MFSPIKILKDCINGVTQEKNQSQKLKNLLPIKTVFAKTYPEDRIKRVTQGSYEKKHSNFQQIFFLQKAVFKKQFLKDRINGVTLER